MVKCQLSYSVTGFMLITAALGFSAVRYLPSSSSQAAALVTLSGAPSALPNRIYCEGGSPRQYSNVHHGWVCSTELAPKSPN
jgi:hypothetical protein